MDYNKYYYKDPLCHISAIFKTKWEIKEPRQKWGYTNEIPLRISKYQRSRSGFDDFL